MELMDRRRQQTSTDYEQGRGKIGAGYRQIQCKQNARYTREGEQHKYYFPQPFFPKRCSSGFSNKCQYNSCSHYGGAIS